MPATRVNTHITRGKQIEVVRRMANMEPTAPDVIREVERGLATRLTSVLIPAVDRVGGIDAVAEVLNCCDRGTEKTILEGIAGYVLSRDGERVLYRAGTDTASSNGRRDRRAVPVASICPA